MSLLLETADIDWSNEVPFNKQFGDFYYQSEGGYEESLYVFLQANELGKRLEAPKSESDSLVIVETGFGTGLNFIATLNYWKALPEPKKRLDYTSIECFPLTQQDLTQAAHLWPELDESYQALLKQYPAPIRGCHSLYFEDRKITLRLIFDTLENTIDQYSLPADVWYLDGFSPSNNTTMWTDDAFSFLAANSNTSTTLSTFTSAGFIRRALESHGFEIKKRTGYGPKREMITARYNEPSNESSAQHARKRKLTPIQPWHLASSSTLKTVKNDIYETSSPSPENSLSVAIVGAGIAGLTSALTLASRGFKVDLLEKSANALAGASSQPQLIMYAKYPKKPNNESKLLLNAQLFAEQFFAAHQQKSKETFWHPVGVAQLSWNDTERAKHTDFLDNFRLPNQVVRHLTREEVREISGINCSVEALYFENAGWLDTKAFERYVLSQDTINWRPNCTVSSIKLTKNEATLHWKSGSSSGALNFGHVVLCNAYDALSLLPSMTLPLKKLRGQTTQILTSDQSTPKTVLCGEGYLCPSKGKEVHLGASYDLVRADATIIPEDDIENIKQLNKWLPSWGTQDELTNCISGSEAGARTTTSDYMPIVGRSLNEEEYARALSGLKQNAKGEKRTYGLFEERLHINVGYGSKGLTFSPSCADLIASNIAKVPNGHSHQLQKMLSPARFIVRSLKKSN